MAPIRIEAAQFEKVPTFRETFLVKFTSPGDAAALRRVGQVLFLMANESQRCWPEPPSGHPRTELRAVLADLRYLEGYLGVDCLGEEYPLAAEIALAVKSERGQGGDEHASGKVVQELLPASAR